jgi:hypothetical protein
MDRSHIVGMCKYKAKYSFSLRQISLIALGRFCALKLSVLRSTRRDCTFKAKMNLPSIATYRSIKAMNARDINADINNTLGADCISDSTVTKYLREKVLRSRRLTRISSRKLKRRISSMKQFLGLLGNAFFPHSVRLLKEYTFQWIRLDTIWSILWGIESWTFDGFPTRSHRAKNKHVSRWVKVFFKFSG